MQTLDSPSYGSPFSQLAPELLTEIWSLVPRASLVQILQVSKTWKEQACEITSLWAHLDFGPRYIPEDLSIAERWIERAKTRKLSITVIMTSECAWDHLLPLFQSLSKISSQLCQLSIEAPDYASPHILSFLLANSFHSLKSLSTLLKCQWRLTPNGRLPSETGDGFTELCLPELAALYCANIPFIFPATIPNQLTEIVFGPYVSEDMLSLTQLGPALESAPLLSRLGFYGLLPAIPPASTLNPPCPIDLPSLTHLSLRRVHPDSFSRFIRLIAAPFLTALTLELRSADIEGSTEELDDLLLDADFVGRLTTFNIQAMWPLTSTFFCQFSNVETLRLNFHNSLDTGFWDILAGQPAFLPSLRNLTLADVNPGHVQELVHLRILAKQRRLECLELLFFRAQDVQRARSPAWSYWLESSVDQLTIPANVSDLLDSFGLFGASCSSIT
ncbi:hypothetical protein B0H11DRAFT_2235160 [Mycena galericulata]|nr:hypothetical protein B0H11DRAFT_2235160 [Mycena galericulata]